MSDARRKKKRALSAGIAIGAGVIAALAVVGGLTAMTVLGAPAPEALPAVSATADSASAPAEAEPAH